MAYFPLQPRYYVFTDSLNAPLDNGYIYIGDANLDPEVYPAKVSWDKAGLYPVTFPIRTIGGYAVRDGLPTDIYINIEDNYQYSILIQDEDEVEVFSSPTGLAGYFPSDTGGDATTLQGHDASYFAVDAAVAHLAGPETITGAKTFSAGLTLANNTYLYGVSTGGTPRPLIAMSSDNVRVGSTTVPLNIYSSNVVTTEGTDPSFRIRSTDTSGVSNIGIYSSEGGGTYSMLEMYYDDTSNLASIKFNSNGVRFIENNSGVETTQVEIDPSGNFYVDQQIYVGRSTADDSIVNFYDLNSTTYRSLKWDNNTNDWYVEDNTSTMRKLWHEGNDSALLKTNSINGSFTTTDGKTITVVDGQITSIV